MVERTVGPPSRVEVRPKPRPQEVVLSTRLAGLSGSKAVEVVAQGGCSLSLRVIEAGGAVDAVVDLSPAMARVVAQSILNFVGDE
ncbi:hypothetical protein [Thioclava sp. GXIMD4215]|uniref:hypothetical protein n=1 Tax=Thioclava sp. GXIMD4215 TaxID=3131928 RepID=UPI00324D30F2